MLVVDLFCCPSLFVYKNKTNLILLFFFYLFIINID